MSERMTAEGFLRDMQCVAEQVRHTQCEIAELDAMLDVSGFDPSRERVGGTRSRDRLAESLHKLQSRRDELAGLLDDYMALQRFADRVIGMVPDPACRRVLNMRYVEGVECGKVAEALCYSEGHERRIHRKAIAILDAVLSTACDS